ncbi:MAG TPA: hypothetical protein VHM92_03135 [Allosphingosinicella sp.]|nr:hypothetical protein [Allosphingosinicella sp.]
MNELTATAALAGFGLAGLGLCLFAALRGWQGWLDLKRLELSGARSEREAQGGSMSELIEMADLKERIRKLESIAACIDL